MRAANTRIASPTLHVTVLFTGGVFLVCLIAAALLRVEITARGTGKIIPVERVQVIQAEFSGPVTEILVRNGSKVEKGNLLLQLDATQASLERDTIVQEEQRLGVEMLRLESFLAGLAQADLVTGAVAVAPFDPQVKEAGEGLDPSFLEEQRQLLAAETEDAAVALRQAIARIEANEKAKEVTRAGIAKSDAAIDIQTERLEAADKLIRSGAASRAAYLSVLETYQDARKQREMLLRELDKQIATRSILEAERRAVLTARINRIRQRRSEIDGRLAVLLQQRRGAERKIAAARLTAPVSGTVEQMSLFTIGGIAQSGESLMRIVPDGGALEVEAVFPNQDSGFLHGGQAARIKLDAFPAERFGSVSAKVLEVSADSVETQPGRWEFVVRLRPEADFLESPAGRFPLRPGMTASIDAITGDRTLLSYFIAPLVEQFGSSLGER
ncbi:HlyD family type I secretion periplasmic adaptor subunit [Nitratireductor sp. ZSWI3]|uniref:HlyD family type I secretion periplasmic adaptor subunit n=1 Tax=Nitratireductor sp. ZSWI3 TaxID=2966359 RepID=UPI00214FF932|nr:HlyD family type I secretion periplasmic adaptor subunit [Nitratireductor sp. ZSWI3]MCR4268898.1 HlyD family type I secretion periplasmic adaptor subunit [Nitratireductor sp. ZSWI3]